MKPLVRNAVSRAFDDGARTVAVLTRGNREGAEVRTYLSREGQFPRQIGTEDFEDARIDIEELPLLVDRQAVVMHAVDRLRGLVPTLEPRVLGQVRDRVGRDGINTERMGADAGPILRALEPIYTAGPSSYFGCVLGATQALVDMGHHLPRIEAVRALRATAEALDLEPGDLDSAIERYATAVLAAAYAAPRMDRGLFVMTAHQAKGKEFDSIVLADASDRFWPEDDDHRRLFYVAITRASRSWSVVAPDRGASSLLRHLTD